MTSISKNVYIDKLDDIVDKYNNTYHTTIKMKPIDVKDIGETLQILVKKLVLSLHYNGDDSYLFVNGRLVNGLLTLS